jgi:hypothetical protein
VSAPGACLNFCISRKKSAFVVCQRARPRDCIGDHYMAHDQPYIAQARDGTNDTRPHPGGAASGPSLALCLGKAKLDVGIESGKFQGNNSGTGLSREPPFSN